MNDEEKTEGTSVEIGGIKFTGGKLFVVFIAVNRFVLCTMVLEHYFDIFH